jgi:hypothetical protein
MSLKVWNSAQDAYSHEQLADNFLKLDQHDHSSSKGTIITGAGIADGSIESRHIYPGTLSAALISPELDSRYIPEYRTTLPGAPVDGQEIFFQADANGTLWHLRYRSGSGSSYKWEFVGGSRMHHEVLTAQTRSADTYADLGTVGPTLTTPLTGEYLITAQSDWWAITSPNAQPSVGLNIGGTGPPSFASGTDQTTHGTVQGELGTIVITRKKTLTATQVIKMVYAVGPVTGRQASFSNRVMSIQPIRVG